MRTVREWIKFLANEKARFAIKEEGTPSLTAKSFYLSAEDFVTKMSDWLDEKVIDIYLRDYVDNDGTTYTLLIYQSEEE